MSMKNSMLFSPLNDKGWTLHVKDWCGVQLPLHESPTLIKCSKIFSFFFTIPIIKSNSKVLASAQPVSAVPIDTIPPRLDKNTRPCLLHNLIYICSSLTIWKIQNDEVIQGESNSFYQERLQRMNIDGSSISNSGRKGWIWCAHS